MIREELKQLSTQPRDLRKFGLVVGVVFVALGAWFLFRRKPVWPYLLSPGAALMFMGVVAPRLLRQVYMGWMAMALTLGLVVSTVILTLFFFLIVTPISLVARLAGKDFLSLKLQPHATSYWIVRPRRSPRRPEEYEQQF